jgi:hypothetical protein
LIGLYRLPIWLRRLILSLTPHRPQKRPKTSLLGVEAGFVGRRKAPTLPPWSCSGFRAGEKSVLLKGTALAVP